MKKIMSLMLGLALVTGAVSFAQDKETKSTTTKKSRTKGGKKKASDKMTTSSSSK